MTELIPCPFCGGEAKLFSAYDDGDIWWVECANKGCFNEVLTTDHRHEEDAIEAWNKRHERTCTLTESKLKKFYDDEWGDEVCEVFYECDECKAEFTTTTPSLIGYCPCCGAKVIVKE